MIKAKARDLYDVIKPFYVPHNEQEKRLFFEKLKFMTVVIRKTLQTDKGKAIVYKHATNFNAQKIFIEFKEHHLTSIKAESEA